MPQVQVIQPIQQQPKRLRVAAYARVSTKSNEQLHSMSVQTEYYIPFIKRSSARLFCTVTPTLKSDCKTDKSCKGEKL